MKDESETPLFALDMRFGKRQRHCSAAPRRGQTPQPRVARRTRGRRPAVTQTPEGVSQRFRAHAGDCGPCETPSAYVPIVVWYPGCAARPWAGGCNAFGVATRRRASGSEGPETGKGVFRAGLSRCSVRAQWGSAAKLTVRPSLPQRG
jgi:hypothetical protein